MATTVSMVMPDLDAFERNDARLVEKRVGLIEEVETCKAAIKQISAQEDIRTYLAIQPKLRAGLTMNPQQQLRWKELLTRTAPLLKKLGEHNTALREARDRCAEIDRALRLSIQARKDALASISCSIQRVSGDTLVRQWRTTKGEPALMQLAPKDLQQRLRFLSGDDYRLFFNDSGSFSWQSETAAPDGLG